MLSDPDRSLDLVSVMEGCKSSMFRGGLLVVLALKGLGAGEGRLVEGIPGITGGVLGMPPGENLDGSVPARALR